MSVRFTNEATVINPPPSPRNSPRISVTPRTRQSGKDSRSPKTHSRGRKRKTKVKKANKSKRGSQKKRGRRASRRQRGGSFCQYLDKHKKFFSDKLFKKIQEVGGRKEMAEQLTEKKSLNELEKYFGTEEFNDKSMRHTSWIEQCSNDQAFNVSHRSDRGNFFNLLININDKNDLHDLLNNKVEKVKDDPEPKNKVYGIILGDTGFNKDYFKKMI